MKTNLYQTICLITLALIVTACGSGGGGSSDNDGWVTITSPTSDRRYEMTDATQYQAIAGDSFISTETSTYCNGFPLPIYCDTTSGNDVAIYLVNETIGYEFTTYPEYWSGAWNARVPMTPGDNSIRVVAYDSAGNSGTARLTINVPQTPDILPTREIDSKLFPEEYGSAYQVSLASNAAGDAVAVWSQGSQIYASIYRDGRGWLAIHRVSNPGTGNTSPKTAIDSSGNAMVIWYENTKAAEGCGKSVSYDHKCALNRRYRQDEGWSPAKPIPGAGTKNAHTSELVMDAQGNALLYWLDFDYEIRRWTASVASYTPEIGWGGITDSVVQHQKSEYQMITDNNGGAIAIWKGYENDTPKVYYSKYSPDNGWSPDIELGDGGFNRFGSITRPRIALSSSGNIIAAWTTGLPGDARSRIRANYFEPGSGWSGQTNIENDASGDASHADVGIDAAGNALVIWQQHDGTRFKIRANSYIPGFGWGAEYDIGSDNPGDAREPSLAMDESGNATAIWIRHNGWTDSVVGNKYSAAMIWSGPEFIEFTQAEGSRLLKIAAGKDGEAIVAWDQYLDFWEDYHLRTRAKVGIY